VSRKRLLVVGGAIVLLAVTLAAVRALTHDSKRPFVLPRCAKPAHSVAPPALVPKSLPLPKGTVFSTLARYPKAIVLGGRTPLELLPATRFFVRELPRNGFRLGTGESEPGFEAEGGFTDARIVGRFKVRVLPRCRGASLLIMSVAPAPQGATPKAAVTVAGKLPACAGAGRSVPSGLPASFPFPHGTVIRSTSTQVIRGDSFNFVSAVAPATIDGAAKFLLKKLPAAGYRLAEADREATEAEAAFIGHGVHGRVRFHTLLACPGALTIDIASTTR
jgi:hypothetical protein